MQEGLRPKARGQRAQGHHHESSKVQGHRPACGLEVRIHFTVALALCQQVENLKEKLISQTQEVSRLQSELVRPHLQFWGGGGVPFHPGVQPHPPATQTCCPHHLRDCLPCWSPQSSCSSGGEELIFLADRAEV